MKFFQLFSKRDNNIAEMYFNRDADTSIKDKKLLKNPRNVNFKGRNNENTNFRD